MTSRRVGGWRHVGTQPLRTRMAQAQRDAACQRIIEATPANITEVNEWYERVKLAIRSNPALRGRLSEGHYTAIIGILRKHINDTPGLSQDKIEADEDLIEIYEMRRKSILALDMVKKPMYIQFNHSGGANLRRTHPYNAPGGAVPVQVLHWTTIREDIGHRSTMRNLRDSGITVSKDRLFTKRIFEANCAEHDANFFFSEHSGIRAIKDSVLPEYCADQFDSYGERFEFNHQVINIRPLLRADYAMKWEDDVIVVFEIKAPDGMQSVHLTRAGTSHGNLVSGYYGVNYNPDASQVGSNVYEMLTRRQHQALLDARGIINDRTVDIQIPQGEEYIRKSVHEIAGYMVAFQRKYAVLSTIEVTWLLKMEDDGRLLTSPGIFGDDNSLNSPTCLLMSFILHARNEALNNNSAHKLEIDPNSRFYDYLDGCWTLGPSRNTEDGRVCEHKRQIVGEMRQAWFAIQEAQLDVNNDNRDNDDNAGDHGQDPGNGGPPAGQPPLPPPANNGGGHGVEGNAASTPENVINQLKNTLISDENLITNKKDGAGYRRLVAINMLPLKRVCIGFPWELTEIHPAADNQVASYKMTIDGIPLMLKLLDPKCGYTKSLFFNEIHMYQGPLRNLQGLCAPYLFYGGKFSQGRQIIVTSREGAPLMEMPTAVLKQKSVHSAMRRAISILHDHGILYGTIDLSAFHMVISGEKMRIYLADYGMARVLPKHSQESVQLFSNEMSIFENFISEISNGYY